MGILNREKRGMRCDPLDEDGEIQSCKPYKMLKGEKVSSGSQFNVTVSKQNNCVPIIQGSIDLLDEDKNAMMDHIETRVKACRRGLD